MLTALAYFYLHHTEYWSTPLLLTALLYGLPRTVTLPLRRTLAHWHAGTLGQRALGVASASSRRQAHGAVWPADTTRVGGPQLSRHCFLFFLPQGCTA